MTPKPSEMGNSCPHISSFKSIVNSSLIIQLSLIRGFALVFNWNVQCLLIKNLPKYINKVRVNKNVSAEQGRFFIKIVQFIKIKICMHKLKEINTWENKS